MASISLICPTIGRATLKRVLKSAAVQMLDGDELFVIADGQYPETERMVKDFWEEGVNVTYVDSLRNGPHGDYGSVAISLAMPMAKGDFIFFIGDDDLLEPNAFATIKAGVEGKPWPHIFAMKHGDSVLSGGIGYCEVSGQQIVFPNVPESIPSMIGRTDWEFIRDLVALWDGKVEFHSEVIATLIQSNRGKMEVP